MQVSSLRLDLMRHRVRVVEAMFWLVLAKCLVHHVRFGLWRRRLGVMDNGLRASTDLAMVYDPLPVYRVVSAVDRASQRLPGDYVCLPRAMAAQWMLARRGTPSTLVFGIARDMDEGRLHDLHAWVEVCGVIVIGAMPERDYARGLALMQP
jgi:Transglutaminase-like superfamily